MTITTRKVAAGAVIAVALAAAGCSDVRTPVSPDTPEGANTEAVKSGSSATETERGGGIVASGG